MIFRASRASDKLQVFIGTKSLRDCVLDELRQKHKTDSSGRLGSKFWASLRASYKQASCQDALQDPLRVRDDSEPVAAGLVEALKQANNPNTTARTRAALSAWFTSVAAVNQREFVGVSIFMKKVRGSVSQASLNISLDYLRFVARLTLHETYKAEWQGMTEWADNTMVSAYVQFKRASLGVKIFWQTHINILPMFMPSVSAEKVLSAAGAWVEIAGDIANVCKSSNIGAKMFGHFQALAAQDCVRSTADEVLKTIKTATAKARDEFSQKLKAAVDELGAENAISERRKIKLVYRGLHLEVLASGTLARGR